MAVITDTVTLSSKLDEFKGSNIASATTTDIGAATGNLVHITGTTTITGLGTPSQAGLRRVVIFDGALTLTHNSSTLALPSAANITTAAGDRAVFVADSTSKWICTEYVRDTAQPIVTATPLTTLNTSYRTLFQAVSSHTAAQVAGTYGLTAGGDAAVVSGGNMTTPLMIMYIDTADFPTVDSITTKLRIRAQLAVNDVAPTGNFTFGLYPVTRPGTSGGTGVDIYTLGTVITGSNGATVSTPAADSHNNLVGADFAIPAAGFYCIGMVTTATVAASSHIHVCVQLQMRNA